MVGGGDKWEKVKQKTLNIMSFNINGITVEKMNAIEGINNDN